MNIGILESNIHMAWMRMVAGRLEMRYRYSKDIVYNNFPWPEPTDQQRQKIEATAKAIREGIFALIKPVITSVLGLCVAIIK